MKFQLALKDTEYISCNNLFDAKKINEKDLNIPILELEIIDDKILEVVKIASTLCDSINDIEFTRGFDVSEINIETYYNIFNCEGTFPSYYLNYKYRYKSLIFVYSYCGITSSWILKTDD